MKLKNSITFDVNLKITDSTNPEILKNKNHCKLYKTDMTPLSFPVSDETSAILTIGKDIDEYFKLVITPVYEDDRIVSYLGITLSQPTLISLNSFRKNHSEETAFIDLIKSDFAENYSNLQLFEYMFKDYQKNEAEILQTIETLKQNYLRSLYHANRHSLSQLIFLRQNNMNKLNVAEVLQNVVEKIVHQIKSAGIKINLCNTSPCYIYESSEFLRAAFANMIVKALILAQKNEIKKIDISQSFKKNVCTICVGLKLKIENGGDLYEEDEKIFLNEFAVKNGGVFSQEFDNAYTQTITLRAYFDEDELHQPARFSPEAEYDIEFQYLTEFINNFFPTIDYDDFFFGNF